MEENQGVTSPYPKVDERRAISDLFGAVRPAFESYLTYVEMIGFARPIEKGALALTTEGQSALYMLEVTRDDSPARKSSYTFNELAKSNKWITVDLNFVGSGVLKILTN